MVAGDADRVALRAAIDDPRARLHFVGIGGTGMSALAQYRAFAGGAVSGSDRGFDRDDPAMRGERAIFERLAIGIHPQDGRGAEGAAAVVVSTAVESAIPDVARARQLGIPVVHRAALLAAHLDSDSVAVAGSSGKSTVTAMIFEILAHAGRDPSLITGGRLLRLMAEGHYGNAFAGSGPLVAEADESDGSLIEHAPRIGVLLNLHRDHMEQERVLAQFATFRARTRGPFIVSDEPGLEALRDGASVFGFGDGAAVRGTAVELRPDGASFEALGVRFDLPVPGRHNVFDALAAIAAARALGIDLEVAAQALRGFGGVHRRFEVIGTARGACVIDDFAHNGEKVAAVIAAARLRGRRLVVFFQPHGFAPLRFLRGDFAAAFARSLRPGDLLFLAPVYFAGGTVAKDIASDDLAEDLADLGVHDVAVVDHERFAVAVDALAREGDVVLVLGARDPSLPDLAREVHRRLASGTR
jgi:UDP-N-acetylmuramate-alanine ligase